MQSKMLHTIIWAATTMGLASMVVCFWIQNNSLKYQMDVLAIQVASCDNEKQNVGNSNSIIDTYDSIMERATATDDFYAKAIHSDDSSSSSTITATRMLKGKGGKGGKGKKKGCGKKKGSCRRFDSSSDDEFDSFLAGKMKEFVRSLDSELIGLGDETSKLMSLVTDLDKTIAVVETGEEGAEGEVGEDQSLLPSYNNRDNNRELLQKNTLKQQTQDIANTDSVVTHSTDKVENLNDIVEYLPAFDSIEPANIPEANGSIPWEMQLDHTLVALVEQRKLLSSGNTRISVVNMLLQTSASALISEVKQLRLIETGLSDEVNKFKEENAKLSASVVDLKEQSQIFNENNSEYAASNSELSKMIDGLKANINDLNVENQALVEQTRALKKTEVGLRNETDRLGAEVNDLTLQREKLQSNVGKLSIENDKLEKNNINLTDNVVGLKIEAKQLSSTIDRLGMANDELNTVAGFLDETAGKLDTSYEAISSFLSQQIAVYRTSILDKLEILYMSRLTNWDCGYRDFFGGEDFGGDFDVPIPDQILRENVLAYIGARVFDDLCLELSDFRAYQLGSSNSAGADQIMNTKIKMTTNQLISSVNIYVMAAMEYYFPRNNDNENTQQIAGLMGEDWATAKYDCQNLADGKNFFMMIPVDKEFLL